MTGDITDLREDMPDDPILGIPYPLKTLREWQPLHGRVVRLCWGMDDSEEGCTQILLLEDIKTREMFLIKERSTP